MKWTSRLTGVVIVLVILASGCGADDPQLEASVDTMVEFEATWQCDVTRFSFDSPEEIDEKRDQTRGRFGVTATDHKIFTDMLGSDVDLREAVASRNDQLCPTVES